MGAGLRSLPLLLLLLPAACGDCGPLPKINHAEPPEDTKHQGSFSVGSEVTYQCLAGYVKRPSLPDTTQCLATSQWSNLPEFCGRSCPSPPRVHFARISPEHETQNFYPVNTTVKYLCRPGYENTTDQLPTSTCHDNLTWADVPELCQRKSCGIPANPEHGRVVANDHLFRARAHVVCDHGYTLKGASPYVWCSLKGSEVAWSQLPACQADPSGKHGGDGAEEPTRSTAVTHTYEPGLQLVGNETARCTTEQGVEGVWSGSPPERKVSITAVMNQTEPSEEKTAENPHWLASVLIPCLIVPPVALGILVGVIMRRKNNKTHSYNLHLEEQKVEGGDPPVHPQITDDEKQPGPWHSYFCHTTSCHVCPTCEERLHAALHPRAEPVPHGCAACQAWLRAQPGTPRTYSVPSIGSGESHSPAGTSSPPEAADVLRGAGTGGAVPEQSEAEQPMDHKSHHICPTCERWLRAHLAQRDNRPVAPGERPGGPRRQDEGPRGPVCASCTDRLHLSLVHSDTARSLVCPLAGEGTPAHLVPCHTPSCHICPSCMAPTHAHLCQPQCWAPDGQMLPAVAS